MTSANIIIRQPSLDELTKVRTLRHEELQGDRPIATPLEPTTDDLKPSAIHIVAFDGDKVVSAVRADPNPNDSSVYCVSRMVTEVNYRKQGIGTQVLKGVETEAIMRGAKGIVLFARVTALGFYEQAGYWNTQIVKDDNYVMVKQVQK